MDYLGLNIRDLGAVEIVLIGLDLGSTQILQEPELFWKQKHQTASPTLVSSRRSPDAVNVVLNKAKNTKKKKGRTERRKEMFSAVGYVVAVKCSSAVMHVVV